MKFSVTELRPNVYHFSFDSQYFLNSTMMRLQEYYESPIEGIKGQYFSYEKFMDAYALSTEHKDFSYFTDWSGFNVPGNIVLDFYDTFKYDLLLKEKTFFEAVFLFRHGKLSGKNKDRFYVLCTYKHKGEETALKHELSHAYWYLFPDSYAGEAKELLNTKRFLNPEVSEKAKKALLEKGYCEEVLEDELQAYLATGSRRFLKLVLRYPDKAKLSTKFKKLFEEFDKHQRIVGINRNQKRTH